MKKKIFPYLLASVAVLEAVFSVSGCAARSPAQQKTAQAGKDAGNTKKATDTGADAPKQEVSEQVTEADLAKLKAKLEILQSNYNDQKDAAQQYLDMAKATSNLQAEELVQSETLRCYEENTLLAVELKTLVMGSLGADVPDSFAQESAVDAALAEYSGYFTEAIKDSVLSEIASDNVREVLKNGISGALDTYRSGGGLTDALDSAANSVIDGVIASIQDAPEKYALAALDQTTGGLASVATTLLQGGSVQDALGGAADQAGGLIGEISGILEYDASPTAFLQELSESVEESSQEVAAFLKKDSITSSDIGKMMYEYTQFGNSLDVLGTNGGAVDFDWKPYYGKMEVAYRQFIRNEMMIEMLGEKAKDDQLLNVAPEAAMELAGMEMPLISEGSSQIEGSLQEQAKALEAQVAEYEAAEEVFTKIEAAGSKLLNPMEEYRSQVEQLDYDCYAIQNYSVNNFQIQYDMEGSEWVQGDNQFNYAVEKLAKYIPGGLFFSMMAAGAIDNNDQYYENMVQTSDAISEACQKCVTDAKEAVEKLSMRLYFLDDLVDDTHDKKTQYQNQCILQRLYGGDHISVQQYMDVAREQLYLLGAQQHFLYQLYKTILTNSSQAEGYEQQYREILEVLSQSGGDDFAKEIPPQKLEKYLAPVMDAGQQAIRGLDDVPTMEGRDNGFFRLYPQQTGSSGCQVDYCYLNYTLTFLSGFMEIYYADGEPFWANGKYLYDGMVLNPDKNTDGAALQEEAEWMSGLPKSTDCQKEFYEHGQRYFAAVGKSE